MENEHRGGERAEDVELRLRDSEHVAEDEAQYVHLAERVLRDAEDGERRRRRVGDADRALARDPALPVEREEGDTDEAETEGRLGLMESEQVADGDAQGRDL